ncbi:MAG: TetR/AcrR family transcriptional regulator [Caldilineales bacterium]
MNETTPSGAPHILQTATRLFISRGYHGLAMREIAEAAEVSKAALYYHFQDKEALFMAILYGALAQLREAIEQAIQHSGLRAQVSAFTGAIFAWPPEQRAIIRLANQEMEHLSEQGAAEFARAYHAQFIEPVQTMLAEGMRRGELRAMDAATATWLLLGMMYPFLNSSHSADPATGQAVAQAILLTFFDGLGL